MKIRALATAAVLGATACALAPAALGATGTLTVQAVVLSASNCKFRPGTGTLLDFGSIDPSSLANKTASVGVVVRCAGSAGTAVFALAAGDGVNATGPSQPRMRHTVNATEFLAYSVTAPIGISTPKNVDTNVSITGVVTPAQFQNAIAGNFTDTVIVTLSP